MGASGDLAGFIIATRYFEGLLLGVWVPNVKGSLRGQITNWEQGARVVRLVSSQCFILPCAVLLPCIIRIPLFCVYQGQAQASALGAQPNALLTVWNLNDLQSKGPVRYGDVLFLQMGRHEVRKTDIVTVD